MRIRNSKILFLLLTLVALQLTNINVYASTSIKENIEINGDINTNIRSASHEWKYKTMNGHIYRRLYDNINHKWLTDWILVE